MSGKQTAPYGSWKSPISAADIATSGMPMGSPSTDGDDLYWLEGRPTEGGRYVLMRRTPDGTITQITPAGEQYNVRTMAHEYGGGAYVVQDGVVYFANFADQRLYRQAVGEEPAALTPEPPTERALRYADMRLTADGQSIFCVCEDHRGEGEARNYVARIDVESPELLHVVHEGHDFYGAPRISPDESRLAFLAWNHPNMPWDETTLWVGDLDARRKLSHARKVAGDPDESVVMPDWSPEGWLLFISDRSDWWNIYRWDEESGDHIPVAVIDGETAYPQWLFGWQSYTVLPGGRIATVYEQNGTSHLGLVEPEDETIQKVDTEFTTFYPMVKAGPEGRVWLIGAGPAQPHAVVSLDVRTGAHEIIRRSAETDPDPDYISEPRQIEYPTTGDRTAHGIFYPPSNADFAGPEGEKPPLLVFIHGGPTGATDTAYNKSIQYWASRGFAIVDVNYGGSTGYGRQYRQRLNGQWGIVDIDDCVAAARYLAEQGEVDGDRLAIRGGSAGGYTTLAALTFSDVFSAGASYFGISDLEVFVADTHKFESRYLDSLVGPYPEAKDVYMARSPIHFTDQLSAPMILLQGLEDKIVPPSQAELMVEALEAKGLPYAYIAFEGEQHGFRKAENIQRALEAEYYFYSKVFGFEVADEIEPVDIKNLDG